MTDVNPLFQDIFLRLLAVSGQAALLALLIVALQRLLRSWLSPAWRYALWAVLPVRLVLLWSVPSAWSLFTVLQHLWVGVRSVASAPGAQHGAPGETLAPVLSTVTPAFSVLHWALGLWLCGALLTLALAMAQAWLLGRQAGQRTAVTDPETLAVLDECRRLLRVRSPIPLLSGPDTSGPGLLGFLRPRLLIPARLLAPEAKAQLRCVLLHELAHVCRRDIFTGWLAYVLLCLHWFNPVLWWAKRRCIDDRELACDARVLSLLSPAERRVYGHALLDQLRLASPSFSNPGLVGVLEGSSNIERRIEMITSFGPSTRRGGIPALAVLLVLSVTALTGAEESVIAQRSAEMAVANSAAPETTVLLARDMPSTRPLALPAETTEPDTAPPQAAPPAATPVSVTEPKTDATQPPAKADKAGTKATAASLRQASTRRPEARTAGISPALSSAVTPPNDREDQGRQDACGTEATAPTPVPQTATKNPATLHNAINKAARDYADSLEVKSTRPGEDLPFTITVGGSIQVRGEYRSGMPKNSALSRSDGFNASMRTRVAVCADFGQAQCVVEASKTQGRNGFLGPRDVD